MKLIRILIRLFVIFVVVSIIIGVGGAFSGNSSNNTSKKEVEVDKIAGKYEKVESEAKDDEEVFEAIDEVEENVIKSSENKSSSDQSDVNKNTSSSTQFEDSKEQSSSIQKNTSQNYSSSNQNNTNQNNGNHSSSNSSTTTNTITNTNTNKENEEEVTSQVETSKEEDSSQVEISEVVEDNSINTSHLDYPTHKGRIDCVDYNQCMEDSLAIYFKYKKIISNVFYVEVISNSGSTLGYFTEYVFKEHTYSNNEECQNVGNNIIKLLSDRITSFNCDLSGTLKINTDY